MLNLYDKKYNPDVLSCLANLSNDEVFTPPELVNKILDLLPKGIWQNPNAKFLDPACKSGVFLREIAKRLNEGLKDIIPDLQERVDNIFKRQLFAIGITELTSLLSRRSVYCSKYPNSPYSVSKFEDVEGNIRFKQLKHTWKNGRCIFCGASERELGDDKRTQLESHAYEFIHIKEDNDLFKRLKDMEFNVIIGNPPYQLNDGGGTGSSAGPIYQLFIEQAKKLNPRFITMIIPARWMTGGKGLDEFRNTMIHDKRISVLHDFANTNDCFPPSVDVKGGVCYFLWTRDKEQKCDIYRHDINGVSYSKRYLVEENDDIFIREYRLISVRNKINAFKEGSVESITSSRKPYGLPADAIKSPEKNKLPPMSDKPIKDGYVVFGLDEKQNRTYKYVNKNYPFTHNEALNKYKVFIAKAYGCGEIGEIPSTPVLSTPGQLCTETFLQFGGFNTRIEAENFLKYIKTKFFRALVGMRKQTQNTAKDTYKYVPLQDFTQEWTDEKLYKKYGLSKEEIDFIESMIKPMDDTAEQEKE